jgi:nicotinamidase-related amidase
MQQIPPAPNPVAVSLDAKSTALVVLDITEQTCRPQANCIAILPRIVELVARARKAGVMVAYTSGYSPTPSVMPEVAPASDETVVQGSQNKFFNSLLDDVLRRRRIATLVFAGWRTNGSILYTSHGATNLRYTVVVADDAIAAPEPFMMDIGRYQILNQLNGNPTNEPLKDGAVTLSRTDLIVFQ